MRGEYHFLLVFATGVLILWRKIRIFAPKVLSLDINMIQNISMKKFFALIAFASVFAFADAQEEIAGEIYDDGIAKKWEFKFDIGVTDDFKTENEKGVVTGNESWGAQAGFGYNITSNWFLGVNSGFYYRWAAVWEADHGSHMAPLLADLVYRRNIGFTEKWAIFVEARGGYLFSLEDDFELYGKIRSVGGYTYFDIQPGIYYRIRRNIDLKVALGWGYGLEHEDGLSPDITQNERPFSLRIGMNFRRKPSSKTRTELLDAATRLADVAEDSRIAAVEASRKAQEIADNKAAADDAERIAADRAAAAAFATAEADKAAAMNLSYFYDIYGSEVLPVNDEKLEQLAAMAADHKINKIIIKGFPARSTGNPYLNRKYARRRAEHIKQQLVKKYGIESYLIDCTAYGEPNVKNDLDRVVTIYIREAK